MDYCELDRNFSCHDCPVLTRRLECHNNRLQQVPKESSAYDPGPRKRCGGTEFGVQQQ
jgi:hypothetical protein